MNFDFVRWSRMFENVRLLPYESGFWTAFGNIEVER
jgi:hypothetical protein